MSWACPLARFPLEWDEWGDSGCARSLSGREEVVDADTDVLRRFGAAVTLLEPGVARVVLDL